MKKNCNIVKDLLPLYIDKVCSKETEEMVEKHLQTCEDCQKYLNLLKANLKLEKKAEISSFKKFVKNINFRIIRNSILLTIPIVAIILGIVVFINNYSFNNPYNEKMRVLLINGDKKKWALNFTGGVGGYGYAIRKEIEVEGNKVNVIFLTWRSTLGEYLNDSGAWCPPDLDYINIDLNDKLEVYYTDIDFKKIKEMNSEEVKNLMSNSELIMTNEKNREELNCVLDNINYSVELMYYKKNNQIISIEVGDNLSEELLNGITLEKGYHKAIADEYGNKNDLFSNIESYFISKGGTCAYN